MGSAPAASRAFTKGVFSFMEAICKAVCWESCLELGFAPALRRNLAVFVCVVANQKQGQADTTAVDRSVGKRREIRIVSTGPLNWVLPNVRC